MREAEEHEHRRSAQLATTARACLRARSARSRERPRRLREQRALRCRGRKAPQRLVSNRAAAEQATRSTRSDHESVPIELCARNRHVRGLTRQTPLQARDGLTLGLEVIHPDRVLLFAASVIELVVLVVDACCVKLLITWTPFTHSRTPSSEVVRKRNAPAVVVLNSPVQRTEKLSAARPCLAICSPSRSSRPRCASWRACR